MTILAAGLSLDVQAPWLAMAIGFLAFGILVATARKTLANFSRKALQEKLTPAQRDRFAAYFDRLDDYAVSLRILDQGARFGVIGSAVLSFIEPAAPRPGAEVSIAWNLLSFLGVMAGVVIGILTCLELVPSILARISPEGLMIRAMPLLDWLYKLTALPIAVFERVVLAGARAVGSQPPRNPEDVVEEEILSAVEDGGREGLLEKDEMSMIEAIFRFRDCSVAEVLTPRTEMVAIDVSASLDECVRLARECGHSRVPVFSGTKDSIVGILYVKDLLKYWEHRSDGRLSLRDIVRKAHFVPEIKKVSELFHEFRSQRFHIAVVQDEFGGTAGLVTIEDIVEEILGEIEDEFEADKDQPRLVRISDEEFEVDARYPVVAFNSELREDLPIAVPEGDGFETLGGFLFNSLERVPVVGETFRYGPLRFEVVEADERMARRLRVHIERAARASATEPAEEGEGVGSPPGEPAKGLR